MVKIAFKLIILVLLIIPMFSLGLLTGVTYLLAFAGSVYKGIIFKRKHIALYLVLGTLLAYVAGIIMLHTIKSFDMHNWFAFAVMMAVAILIWYESLRMRLGKR